MSALACLCFGEACTCQWSPVLEGRPRHLARCRPVAHQARQGCPWSLGTPTPAPLLWMLLLCWVRVENSPALA